MKKVKRYFFWLLSLFLFYKFFLPFPHVASDLHYESNEYIKSKLGQPYVWSTRMSSGFGEYAISTLWSWPVHFLWGLLANVGFQHTFLNQVLIFLSLTIGFVCISRFFEFLGVDEHGRGLGIIFYLSNTYSLLLLDGGQLTLFVAYILLPVGFYVYLSALEKNSLKYLLKFSLVTFLISIFDIRIIYILFVLILIRIVFNIFLRFNGLFLRRLVIINFKVGITTLLIFLGLHSYWILPSLFSRMPSLPSGFARVQQVEFLSFANLGHALFLLQPHWYKNVFGKVTPILPGFILIPLLVFLTPILVSLDKNIERKKEVGFWLLVALVSVFLTKGSNPPLGEIYQWLFLNVPGFSLFRDSTKFFFLVALSYSVLIGITSEELIKRFNWKLKIGKWKLTYFSILLTSYFLTLIRPVWLGEMTGTFSPPAYQDEYERVNKILEEDKSFGRILFIPTKTPLGYSSPSHPSLEAQRLVNKRPFEVGIVGSYELFNFLRDAPFSGELFDISGIKYIVYPYPDIRREDLKEDNIDYYYMFLDQLTNLSWIESIISSPPVSLLRVKNSQDRFFIVDNTLLVVGSDRIYNELLESKNFKLNKNALIFAEDKPGLVKYCKKSTCRVLLYRKDTTDLTASFLDKNNFVYLSDFLDFDPDETGWWKRETYDFLWFRNFLQQKYGIDNQDFDYKGGYAISEGNNQIVISNDGFVKRNTLLVRVMQSSKGGKVEFFQESQKIGEVDTKIKNPEKVEIKLTGYKNIPDKIFIFDDSYFNWYKIGDFISNSPLIIKTSGEINVVNALVALEDEKWQRINELIHEIKTIKWEDLSDTEKSEIFLGGLNTEVSYKQISPTRYKLNVKGLTSPTTLVFSENYDPLWRITNLDTNEKSYAFPLYSLINGFYIDKDGEYDIYFEPQKYVLPGLIISGFTLFSVLFLLLLLRKKKKS